MSYFPNIKLTLNNLNLFGSWIGTIASFSCLFYYLSSQFPPVINLKVEQIKGLKY